MIVFAGPGVAGAIRNQFNLVGNTVNSGATGGTEGGASGGGSAGADSATVQAAIAKDAKDWTLDEQKAVAEDIAKNGTSSIAYAKAEAAMKAGTYWSVKLTDGTTMSYQIIGINHDELEDGSGKAGLTFRAGCYGRAMGGQRMNSTDTNLGGWEKSEIRARLNSGELWSLLPSEMASKIKPVKKETCCQGGGKLGDPVTTVDKLFLLSLTEIYGPIKTGETEGARFDGGQYEYFVDRGVSDSKGGMDGARAWNTNWLRSVTWTASNAVKVMHFYENVYNGIYSTDPASSKISVNPAWCF